MTVADNRPSDWINQVLAFWFEELNRADWFQSTSAVDEAIRSRFLQRYEVISRTDPSHVLSAPEHALAAVIVLDQFPRNLFRGTPKAFATDPQALKIATLAVEAGMDAALPTPQKLFLYLPFEHSEMLRDQERAVELISALGDEDFTGYALAHKNVIERFGRFPHRNAIMQRASTAQEEDFLRQPGSSF